VRPWIDRYTEFMAYLRRCDWRIPFIMKGTMLYPIGMMSQQQQLRAGADNDNRRRT